MKSKDRDATAALRSAIAAIDNAEAVPVDPSKVATTNEHVAGASVGLGSADVERRQLTADQIRALLEAEVNERAVAADQYAQLGRDDHAASLRREADVLRRYLR